MDSFFQKLLRSTTTPRIAVLGDTMIDVYQRGRLAACQDHCPRFQLDETVRLPGGAGNAARTLQHWKANVYLVAPVPLTYPHVWHGEHPKCPTLVHAFDTPDIPIKTRLLDEQGRIAYRIDHDPRQYGLDDAHWQRAQQRLFDAVAKYEYDVVLISDYDKGILGLKTLQRVIVNCEDRGIPVVVDAKRCPSAYQGAILKHNLDYAERYRHCMLPDGETDVAVQTRGHEPPVLLYEQGERCASTPADTTHFPPISCINHVGAGDCFAAHLALCLSHGLSLADAACIAHSAGRIYVQHPLNRPPWPHEIQRDLDPVGGKVLRVADLAALRQSNPSRIVFTNGVFRHPHAGHAWFLRWAKQQGHTLVVGINDDVSSQLLRPGQAIRPLEERLALLTAMECVDWICPFPEPTPSVMISALQPDTLCKGHEYTGKRIPGDETVKDVRFAPPSPFPAHCTDLEARTA